MRFVLLGAVAMSCSTLAPMVRMEPLPAKDHDVQFRNGRPIVFSHGERFDVAVSPKGGPTGRYKLERRLELMVGVRNRSGQRIEVSERNISASGNGSPARLVRAVEIEDAIISNASWAQAINAFAGVMRHVAAGNAGTTTFSATVDRPGEIGQTRITGESHNEGAAMQAQRQVEADTAKTARAIKAQARADLDQVATAFQRNTIESGETYVGAVMMEPPRTTACGVLVEGEETSDSYGRPGPCKIRVTVTIEDETHAFDFDEVVSK